MKFSIIHSLQSGVFILQSCNPMLSSKEKSGCLCLQGTRWPVDRGIRKSLLRSRTRMQWRAPGWLPWPRKLRLHSRPCRQIPHFSLLSPFACVGSVGKRFQFCQCTHILFCDIAVMFISSPVLRLILRNLCSLFPEG